MLSLYPRFSIESLGAMRSGPRRNRLSSRSRRSSSRAGIVAARGTSSVTSWEQAEADASGRGSGAEDRASAPSRDPHGAFRIGAHRTAFGGEPDDRRNRRQRLGRDP